MAAFARAHVEGADGIELDVRLCATGEVVVFHDPDLSRATNERDARRVCDVSWSELAKISLFGSDARIPRLAEVLDFCGSRDMWLNVEVKYDVPDKLALARAVAHELSESHDHLVVSSFDPRLLVAMRAMGLHGERAWLTDQGQKNVALLLPLVRRPFVHGAHLNRAQATPSRVAEMRRRGLFVGVWTVNDPAEAKALSALGVRFIITDAPKVVRESIG